MKDAAAVTMIVGRAAAAFGVTRDEIAGRVRRQRVARARQAVYFALYERGGWSLNEIGDAMGRDHSTVLHGIQKARLLRDNDHGFATELLYVQFGDAAEADGTYNAAQAALVNLERTAESLTAMARDAATAASAAAIALGEIKAVIASAILASEVEKRTMNGGRR